ncbi:MAG: glycoside hydrolase family 28 protein [Candidatus Acidiferrum sp.]
MTKPNPADVSSSTRREFLDTLGKGAALLAASPLSRATDLPSRDPWEEVPFILQRIKPPSFPERSFDVAKYGATGDGKSDCTEAIRQAISACHDAGGGHVLVPAGVFLTGAIYLKSNVDLHLSAAAVLRFSRDTRQYLPVVFTRWEGIECMNYSPFIYAFGEENLGLTGEGTLDGNSDNEHWWPWKGKTEFGWREGLVNQEDDRNALMAFAEKEVPVKERVFGGGHYLRPQFIQPYRCKNILIDGITIKNSPMWEIHPVLSSNITVRNVKVVSHGPNNDGCDPECCTDVLIDKCSFDTGDDCIAIKAGRNQDGRRVGVPCENIVIQGCRMKDGHGGVALGSEMSGDIRRVFVEDCQMDSPHLERALRLKTNAIRGGELEQIYVRNIKVGQVAEAVIEIDFNYEEGNRGPYRPAVRIIEVSNVSSNKSKYAIYLRGFPSAPIRNISLVHCTFDNVSMPSVIENVRGLRLTDVKVNEETVMPDKESMASVQLFLERCARRNS